MPPCVAFRLSLHTTESGADTQTRTEDLSLTRRLLYQLSYIGDELDG